MSGAVVEGHALVLGDNVSTDDIIAGRYLHITDPRELARHLFENRPEVRRRLEGTPRPIIIVAGRGFGYGSSREHAPIALKAYGVVAVVADSFHRIFYRNAVNNGLLAVEARGVSTLARDGDPVRVDLARGVVEAPSGSASFRPIPEYVMEIIRRGGLRGMLEGLSRRG